jgi:hypothetical protein
MRRWKRRKLAKEVIRSAIEVRDMWTREAGALYTRFDCGCRKGTHTICDQKRAVDAYRRA